MFCACELLQLVSVRFCVVTDVYKCGCGLVINETETKEMRGRKVTLGWTHIFLTGNLCFSPTVADRAKGIYPRCVGQLNSLE